MKKIAHKYYLLKIYILKVLLYFTSKAINFSFYEILENISFFPKLLC